MNELVGVLTLLTGIAYTSLGVLTAYDLVTERRNRGRSYFGLAFLAMAATCGPHHLACAVHILFEGDAARPSHLAALLIALPPGAAFIYLRLEVMLGGRGERFIAGAPGWLVALPWLTTLVAGAVLWAAWQNAREYSPLWVTSNAVLLVAYTVVGVLILHTQVARFRSRGGWSLAGISFGMVFPTCGVAHAAASLNAHVDWHLLLIDGLGVPASLYFLWVVRGIHRDTLRDWNRSPLVGAAGNARRSSPWRAAPAGVSER